MTYTIAAGKSFNMVLSHIDHTDPATWNPETAIKDMQSSFSGWDSCLTKIINMIDKTLKWPLIGGTPLSHWVAPGSRTLILGDAAHAMVPYMSQGAAMAVEDGAALAVVLSLIQSPKQIPEALRVFEAERIKRSGQMQGASMLNGKLWHFADGPEQRARDAGMRPETEGASFSWSSNQWSDPVTQWWAYGYDAEAEMEKAWHAKDFFKSNIQVIQLCSPQKYLYAVHLYPRQATFVMREIALNLCDEDALGKDNREWRRHYD